MFQGSTSLKYFKRLRVFKNSTGTVQYLIEAKQGWSYNWCFAAVINGVMVLNNYKWSVTTSGHQSAMRSLFKERGIKYITADFGNADMRYIEKNHIKDMYKRMYDIEIAMDSARIKNSSVQSFRQYEINELKSAIDLLVGLDARRFKVSQKDLKVLYAERVENALNDFSDKQAEKVFKVLSLQRAETDLNNIAI